MKRIDDLLIFGSCALNITFIRFQDDINKAVHTRCLQHHIPISRHLQTENDRRFTVQGKGDSIPVDCKFVLNREFLFQAQLFQGRQVRSFLIDALPLFNEVTAPMRWLLTLVGLFLMTLIFVMLYVLLPNGKRRFRSQIPGALFTTIAWTIYTWIYSIYLTFAKNLSIVYGGLASSMGTMLWLYFCLYLFFFGAEVNEWLVNPDSFPF